MRVTLIDHMGDDLSVVNAARVSFGKTSKWLKASASGPEGRTEFNMLSPQDQSLIGFLARGCTTGEWDDLSDKLLENTSVIDGEWTEWYDHQEREDLLNHIRKMPDHWTPFGHTAITLHIKAPLFVARQLGKHQVGFVWNEVSRRYITDEPEFYTPDTWRKAAENVKQGSSDEEYKDRLDAVGMSGPVREVVESAYDDMVLLYRQMLAGGCCAEQARMVLPQSMYTEWYWTGNLYGFANVYNQRTDSHAQKEVQDVAHQIGDLIKPLFPVSWEALTK